MLWKIMLDEGLRMYRQSKYLSKKFQKPETDVPFRIFQKIRETKVFNFPHFFLSIFEFFFTCFFYANRKKSITLKKQFMDISKIYSWFFFCVLQKKKNQPYTLQKVIVTFIFHTYWSKNGNIVLKSTVFWIFSKVEKISKKH